MLQNDIGKWHAPSVSFKHSATPGIVNSFLRYPKEWMNSIELFCLNKHTTYSGDLSKEHVRQVEAQPKTNECDSKEK